VADLIGTLDPEERARGKIVSHLLPTWYKKETFIHFITSRTRTRESKVTTLIQNRPPTSRKKINKKKNDGCFVCRSTKHWASACPNTFVKEKKSAKMVINETGGGTSGYGNALPYVLSVCNSPKWWMDCGANIHVCAYISLYASF
jgi:flavoprotein